MTNPAEMFSTLAASRHSVRAFKPDPVPSDVLDAILADASAAPSWSNTRPFALALATGERADRLRAAYTEEFDRTLDVQHRKPLAAAKLVLSGHAPDGDYKVWKPYPEDLRPHQVEVARLLYGAYGVERHDHEGRDRANRRNAAAFDAPVIGFAFVHKGLMPFSALDAGIMLQTLWLSAKAHGVDSCPLGILAAWRRPVDAEFDVPRDYALITGFALGYADPEAPVNAFRARPATGPGPSPPSQWTAVTDRLGGAGADRQGLRPGATRRRSAPGRAGPSWRGSCSRTCVRSRSRSRGARRSPRSTYRRRSERPPGAPGG